MTCRVTHNSYIKINIKAFASLFSPMSVHSFLFVDLAAESRSHYEQKYGQDKHHSDFLYVEL